MSYTVTIKPRAIRGMARVPAAVADRLQAEIETLSTNPRAGDVKRLKGRLQGVYRRRLGDYRILYTIDDTAKIVDVVGIGHRSRIYD
ncbi:MAG: type II toxin-antitoxin system RelE/ParE family toxin [Armatimonadetes bacterium]|nr:type II toxin-antitoxin system RelE/ParE family toxin [Armatimonadota bacterium]